MSLSLRAPIDNVSTNRFCKTKDGGEKFKHFMFLGSVGRTRMQLLIYNATEQEETLNVIYHKSCNTKLHLKNTGEKIPRLGLQRFNIARSGTTTGFYLYTGKTSVVWEFHLARCRPVDKSTKRTRLEQKW